MHRGNNSKQFINHRLSSRSNNSKKRFELSDEQKKELREAFDLFDDENSGHINCHELKVCMRALGFEVKKKEVLELVNEVDVNDSGRIDYADFLSIMKKKFAARDPDDDIIAAFQLFDHDQTGKISLKVR